jgi:hypothetical protein
MQLVARGIRAAVAELHAADQLARALQGGATLSVRRRFVGLDDHADALFLIKVQRFDRAERAVAVDGVDDTNQSTTPAAWGGYSPHPSLVILARLIDQAKCGELARFVLIPTQIRDPVSNRLIREARSGRSLNSSGLMSFGYRRPF